MGPTEPRSRLIATFQNRTKPPRGRLRRAPQTVRVPYADDPGSTYAVGTNSLYRDPKEITLAKATGKAPGQYVGYLAEKRGKRLGVTKRY